MSVTVEIVAEESRVIPATDKDVEAPDSIGEYSKKNVDRRTDKNCWALCVSRLNFACLSSNFNWIVFEKISFLVDAVKVQENIEDTTKIGRQIKTTPSEEKGTHLLCWNL